LFAAVSSNSLGNFDDGNKSRIIANRDQKMKQIPSKIMLRLTGRKLNWQTYTEAELRDREVLSLPGVGEARHVIDRARQRTKAIVAQSALPSSKPQRDLIHVSPDSERAFDGFVADWTKQLSVPEVGYELALKNLTPEHVEQVINQSLESARGPKASVYGPALALAQYRRAWTSEIQGVLVGVLSHALASPVVEGDVASVPALAAVAATFSAVEVAEELFRTLLSSRATTGLRGWHKTICMLSLARLASPVSQSHHSKAASSAAHYFLKHRDISDVSTPFLQIAALMAPDTNQRTTIHQIGLSLFEHDGLRKTWKDKLDAGAIIRNLGLALHFSGFGVLQDSIESLMERDTYGPAFVAEMRSPAHRGLELKDTNSDDEFVVLPGLRVAECLGLQERRPTPLKATAKTAARLSEMLSTVNWTSARPGRNEEKGEFESRLLVRHSLSRLKDVVRVIKHE
jgi:hypothetical protein